jgi:hypothetical protein
MLRVIEDFLPEAEAQALRELALAADYEPFLTPGTDSVQVRRAARMPLPAVMRGLGEALGRPVEAAYSGFRLDYAGEHPNTPVHFDGDVSRWAAVYYLNPPGQCRGGTAFWRHRQTGLNAVPPDATADIEMAYRIEGNHADHWTLESIIGMRFNRVIVYPTNYFHSRYPIGGWGTNPEDGRLVCGVFFNLMEITE